MRVSGNHHFANLGYLHRNSHKNFPNFSGLWICQWTRKNQHLSQPILVIDPMLLQCWPSVAGQYWNSIGPMTRVCWGAQCLWPVPMVHSIWLLLETQRYWVQIPALSDTCHPHIQCSKLFKGLECVVLSIVLYTMKNPWNYRVRYSTDFGFLSVAILAWLLTLWVRATLLSAFILFFHN